MIKLFQPARHWIVLFLVIPALSAFAAPADTLLPEPGPEAGGLRMRLHVIPVPNAEGYNVRVDLMNETKREVTIRADTKAGPEPTSLNDYIELSTSIETYPTIVPWIGGVAQRLRNGLPAEYVLPAGEVISTRLADHWTAPQELRGQS